MHDRFEGPEQSFTNPIRQKTIWDVFEAMEPLTAERIASATV
jgi:hypothetical protein